MASTATSALASVSPAYPKLVPRLQATAAPQSVGLPWHQPTLHVASPNHSNSARSWKAASYCRRAARDVVSRAVGEAPAEVAIEVPEVDKVSRAVGEAPAEVAIEVPEVVKTIQDAWNKVEDKYAVTSLAVAGFIGVWATSGIISAVDRLPLVPGVFELVGIGYTGWFAYHNVVFKADREALVEKIKSTYSEIIGSS